ncbi:MAG: lysylphosphatidylglycerol synthase domain-containing protein [Gammaproteobacteria bacterium]
MTTVKLKNYVRLVGFVVLAVVTLIGVYHFLAGDWTEVVTYWRGHMLVIPLLALISVIDNALEAIAWMWVYHRFRIRAFDRGGSLAYLASRAGLLLPAQLGRLIRPDAMVKLQRAPLADCLKAEAVVFVLDVISIVAFLAGLLVYQAYPAAAPLAAVGVIGVLVFLVNRIANLLTHTRLQLPRAFWWAWPTMAIILILMASWVAYGLGLHVVVTDLPGDMTLWDSLFFGPGSALLGASTGLPSGIGATEGLLGASLRLRSVPIEHLAIAVTAFRLITFWIWIPIGWLALAVLNRRELHPTTSMAPTGLREGKSKL